MNKRIIFSGGGTGGHIYPALAIRDILMEGLGAGIETAYAGVSTGMEAKLAGRVEGLAFLPVKAQGMPREASMKWLSFPLANLRGIYDALKHVRAFQPDLTVTTGGFVAFPMLLASVICGVPAVIHEQNATMGLTNRVFARFAARVLLTYPGAWRTDDRKFVHTGNPVRKEFFGDGSKISTRFQKRNNETWILFVGGSRGAHSINTACAELVEDWLPSRDDVHILHISGERDYDKFRDRLGERPRYTLMPYLHEMKDAFDVADLLVSRAGATILAELAVCRKPAVLVPYPFATDKHQDRNAASLEELGAAKVVADSELTGRCLSQLLDQTLKPEKLEQMAAAMAKSRPADVETRILNEIKAVLIGVRIGGE